MKSRNGLWIFLFAFFLVPCADKAWAGTDPGDNNHLIIASTGSVSEAAEAQSATTTDAAGAGQPKTETPVESNEPQKPSVGPLALSGTTELINQAYSNSGNQYNFLSQNSMLYYNRFRQRINLRFDGELENDVKLSGEFMKLPYMDNVFSMRAQGKNYFANIGDTTAKFTSGEMTAFSKSVRGLDFGYKFGKTDFGFLYSKQKSKTQSEKFNGRNIRGPYVLRNNSIVENTEVVRINGRLVPRSEYFFDYFLGQITFNYIADPSDIIEITYEASMWLDLKTGDLFGLSLKSRFLKDKATAGVSYLKEETSVMPRAEVFSTVRSDQKQNLFDAALGGYRFNLGQTRLEKNYEIVTATTTNTIYLNRDTDYTIDYTAGIVDFMPASAVFTALPGTADIAVTFNYYEQGYLQWVQDEELSGDGQLEYKLAYQRIYSGTEYVAIYENGAFIRQLYPNVDYQINEGNNTIVFLTANVIPSSIYGRTVRISYEIVPETERVSGQETADRTVVSLFGSLNLDNATLTGELAQGNSDLRLKTVPVIEELVGFVANAQQRMYTLQHEALYNSVEVFFNDTVGPSSRQFSGTDYVLENDPVTGHTRLNFKHDIPVGTTIIANYKYQPDDAWLRNREGRAGRATLNYSVNNLALNAEYMRKGPYFAPLTSYNDLENERILANLNFTGIRNLSLNLDYAHQKSNTDLTTDNEIEFNKIMATLGYSFGEGKQVLYSLEQFDRADNLGVHLTNNDLNGHRIELRYRLSSKADTSMLYETREFSDSTRLTSDRDVKRGMFVLNYNPADNFRFAMVIGNSKLTSMPPPNFPNIARFDINTFSTQINAMYTPRQYLALNVNLDMQSIEDTRAGTPDYDVDNIRVDLSGQGNPNAAFKIVDSYVVSFYRQDRMDLVYGDSRTDITTTRITFNAGSQFQISPSYIATVSNIGTGSNSEDDTVGLLIEYRPKAQYGWRASTSYTSSNRSNTNVVSSTPPTITKYDSDQKQFELNVNYVPNDRLNLLGKFQSTGNESSGTTQTRNTYVSKIIYNLNKRSALRLAYNLETNPKTVGDRTAIELGATHHLDRYMDVDLEYKKSEQNGSGDNDFAGTLFTGRLILSF